MSALKFKLFIVFSICCSLYVFLAPRYFPQEEKGAVTKDTSYEERAHNAIQSFAKALKTELTNAISTGGMKSAIPVCQKESPLIAKAIAEQEGLTIGRTSLKIRNFDNTPNKWEYDVLRDFERRKNDGVPIEKLEVQKTTDDAFYMMKAIPIKGVCTACHGEKIAPDLSKEILKHYPNDEAIGFKLNELRGAFTIIIPIEKKD